jgi:hypothetical protein
VDPLTFAVDILCASVYDSDVFDATFRGLVAVSAEGRVIKAQGATGVPFTEDVIQRLGLATGMEPMQPAGAAVLQLAWRHHVLLLG